MSSEEKPAADSAAAAAAAAAAADQGPDVPWPDEWLEESRKYIIAGILLLSAAVVGAAFLSYRRWDAESYGQSIACGFLAIIGLAWLRYVVVSKLRDRWKPLDKLAPSEVPDVDEVGLVFQYAPVLYRVYWSSLIVVILLSAGIAGGLVALGMQDGWSWYLYLEIVVMALMTLYGLRFLLEFVRHQVRPGLVGLTPRGVYHRSWTFSGFMPWEYVESVAAIDISGPVVLVATNEDDFVTPVQQTSRIWKQGELELLPDLAIRTHWFSIDSAVVYYAIRYYFLNPAARAELGTDAGAARVQTQQLLTPPDPKPAPGTPAKAGAQPGATVTAKPKVEQKAPAETPKAGPDPAGTTEAPGPKA